MSTPKDKDLNVYRCPSCGAPSDPRAALCAYCKSPLHPTRCSWCFAWVDDRVKDCGGCGAESAPEPDGRELSCPHCRTVPLHARALKKTRLASCGSCGGVWTDQESFKTICAERADESAYLGEGAALPRPKTADPLRSPVQYRPCPSCGELMNRINFAGCSGVILDMCKHGVWFDAEEMKAIVAFIKGGGLDLARKREREGLELERRRLERAKADREAVHVPGQTRADIEVIFAAKSIVKFFS